ncbi:LysE family translocator [Paenibacillus xanthanilyticus]|uniref:LysE family translocator n=1 Tax=Paenibacillus xanthanilyticus TaxID=1783531 RepID=A0ABV8K1H3_9BACL
MSIIIAMCLFSFSMSISPGPVNLTILSLGIQYGFKRSLSFVSGATFGFALLLAAVGLGIANLVEQVPFFHELLRYIGAGYMIYVGCRMITARPELQPAEGRPLRYRHGFLMQWLNPKAWIACLSGASAFGLNDSHAMLAVFVAIYFTICYLSLAAWALLGARLQGLVTSARGVRILNCSTGSVLLIVAIYLLR